MVRGQPVEPARAQTFEVDERSLYGTLMRRILVFGANPMVVCGRLMRRDTVPATVLA